MARPKRKPNIQIELDSFDLEHAFTHRFSMSSREILLDEDLDDTSFLKFDIKMTKLESQSSEPITVKINSDGGYPDVALAIVGRIRESKCKVITKGYGTVASAATIILAAGHERHISKYCMFMHHEASYGEGGRHSDVKTRVVEVEKQERRWAKHLAEFTKKSASFWYESGKRKDLYLTPEQCLEYGIVDSIF